MNVRTLLGLCLGSLLLAGAPARAEPSPYLGRDNPLAELLPSAQASAARERTRYEREIAHALSALPNVQRAEALIRQPEPGSLPLDAPLPDPQVLVRLEQRTPGPSKLEIERAVRSILPALEAGQLKVVHATSTPAHAAQTSLARVGPFVVARESSSPLRATLIACLGANALLASLLLVRRRTR